MLDNDVLTVDKIMDNNSVYSCAWTRIKKVLKSAKASTNNGMAAPKVAQIAKDISCGIIYVGVGKMEAGLEMLREALRQLRHA